ncbi:MAG: class I SAM-dependent methyltransferase [Eubacteriales bacterium]
MEIKKIIELSQNPKPYDKGTSVMWTDSRITPKLLETHLNENFNAASRTPERIEKIVDFISKCIVKENASILDLGCGPGLYAERLTKLGHKVTGVDFSQNSIDYAAKNAEEKGMKIDYVCGNYLDIDYTNKFDLVMIIYCDFGVLSENDRNILIKKIYNSLKPGGIFIFDSYNKNALDSISFEKTWDLSSDGFWRTTPHICMTENLRFEKEKALLEQHIVIEESGEFDIYRFWNHYFDLDDIKALFLAAGFPKVESFENIVSDTSQNTNEITFYKITK